VEEFIIDTIVVGSGSISPPGPVNVTKDGSITFSIIPDSGYQIADLQVDDVSQGVSTSYTFNKVNTDHSLKVFFTASSLFTITTNPGSNGSISPAGPVAVSPGANMTFSIIPDAGYRVDEVKVDGKKKGELTSYIFEDVYESHNISATFVVDEAAPPDDSCVEISDVPLEARFQSAPANILIALDDSGSMSYEILVPGARDGRYLDYFDYVFDNPCGSTFGSYGCHEYDRDSILVRGQGRLHWKTQWSGFNKVYYDPTIDYEPWPDQTGTGIMDNADANNPRAHPMHVSPVFDLSSSFDTVSDGSFEIIADDEDTAIFTKTGDFMELTDSQAYQNHYWAARKTGSYTATWTPYVPGGTYKVYARWRQIDDRWKDVPYTIVHAGGTAIVEVDQRSNGGSWVELGIYTFNSGIAKVSINGSLDKDNEKTFCADAIKFVPEGNFAIDIPRAHYYVKSASSGKPYLVFVDGGAIDYYEFYDADADDVVDPGELLPSVNPPSDVKSARSYAEERQNFANWYSYYRRRAYTATYATAELITNMQAVRIGIYGINIGSWFSIVQPVLNIKNDGEDHTEDLLRQLYTAQFKGGTPLRKALEAAGRYFDKHDNKMLDDSPGDDSPWDTTDDGGTCQQAFTILITDGYYNGKDPSGAIGNADGDNGQPYADTYSKTLADVAMYYYERDLNTELADNVPANDYDSAPHQHMVTYSVGFGVVGMNDPDDYDADLKHKTTGDTIVWPDPGKTGQTPEKIDDLWHAAVNAHGQFLNSSNPKELVYALREVMKDIERRVFSSSGVSINGDQMFQVLQPGLLMFQASYSSEGWTGEVKAFNVDDVNGDVDTNDVQWSATDKMEKKSWSSRLIASYNPTTGAGIPFRFDSLDAEQKTLLDPNWETDDSTAREIMDFLRGDRSNEFPNGSLRTRYQVLGDIVHSSPAFKNEILYAGANDGMLHAFDANTGEELFAYVPNLVFENLRYLSEADYAHRFYVDLTPTIEDVNISGVTTMLVGGLGKGGRGYFALNISGFTPTTVPGTEMALDNQVMWEYPDAATLAAEINDLGYSFSRVSVVKSNDTADAPWIVMFGNGYNSANGHAVLFILDPTPGATQRVLRRIDTGVGTCNGLSTPAPVDVDYNGTVDYVYAGDLKGNLWKFDLTADDYNQWSVAYNESGTPKPLFQTPPGQPIITRPDVMFHCEKNGYMVIFGTGRYMGLADLADNTTQAVYGIWDYGDDEDPSEYVGAFNGSLITDTHLPATVSLLQQIVYEYTVDGVVTRVLSAGGDTDPDSPYYMWKTTTEASSCGDNEGTDDCDPNALGANPDPVRNVGWYFNLPETGERVLTDVSIRYDALTVISYVNEGSTCGLSGHSWVMVLDTCTGGRQSEAYFDFNGDEAIDDQDLVEIPDPADPTKTILVPPTGRRVRGKVEGKILTLEPQRGFGPYGTSGPALSIGNKGNGDLEKWRNRGIRRGMTYWRIRRQ